MKRIPGSAVSLAIILGAATLTLACEDTGPAGGDSTSVTVLLTDAPGDVVHVWVDIGEIYLQGNEEDENAGGRVTLFTGPSGPLDLLELIDDPAVLNNVVIPAGRYGQLRVVIEGAAIELEEEGVFATTGFDPPGETAVTGQLV